MNTRIRSALLNIFGDIFSYTSYTSQLCFVITFTLKNLLQQSLKSFHRNNLQISIRCQASKPGPESLAIIDSLLVASSYILVKVFLQHLLDLLLLVFDTHDIK